jgi:acyl-CoA thioester hydrolase
VKLRVYYEDTDEQGVVYYANYLKFCERARSEIFFQKSVNIFNKESYFVVKNIDANYLSSAKLGDILSITSSLVELKRASLVLIQRVFRDDIEIFNCKTTLVYMSSGSISKITDEFRELFLNLQ